MDASSSFLSNAKYGYDFVVATTEASINSDLKAYLVEGSQPVEYLCFLADPETGNPSQQISLDELKDLTGGVDPFDITADTPYSDARITSLTQARFMVGIKMQMGLPPGILPKDMPAIVTLGGSAENVKFNLFCSQFSVIQNSPPNGWGGGGAWNIWSQEPGKPWYAETRVNLVNKDLDKELDTPYLNSHPDLKAQLKRQLLNMGADSFSLKQLLFDLDNAVLETPPTFIGVPEGSNAEAVLQKAFVGIYSTSAKDHGLPLVSVTARSESSDPSQLQLTGFERQVSVLKDANGVVIENPTSLQQSATTLDHLCAANHHALPGAASFNWNWVLPKDIDSKSGVIAINRQAIGGIILEQLLPWVKRSCLQPVPWAGAWVFGYAEYSASFEPNQTPQVAIVTDEGEDVIQIRHQASASDESKHGATYAALGITSKYNCDVKFVDNTIVVTQRLIEHMRIQWDDTHDEFDVLDKTLTDPYTISVDQYGGLKMTKGESEANDQSHTGGLPGWINALTGVDDVLDSFKNQLLTFEPTQLQEIPFNQLQNFVFPGGKVFTYKGTEFSDHQDLVCDITYVDPSQTVPSSAKRLLSKERSDAVVSRKADNTGPIYTLTETSELMQNYLHGETVSPTGKFEALQTADGHALLFAIDSSGVFHVMEEQSGRSRTGWQVSDLSSDLIRASFPDRKDDDVVVSTFDVGQNVVDGSIGLMLALRSGGTDYLYISLYNSSADTSWLAKPTWTPIPFDAATERPETITITGAQIAEMTGSQQYLIVDIDRPTESAVKHIARYHIDPQQASGSRWVKHDVPVDIEDGDYQSCVGRMFNGYVDGVYTSGNASGEPQLVFVPVINVFGSGPPLPLRLSLPGGGAPSAITTARYGDQSSGLYEATDLYAVRNSTLYRFPADTQSSSGAAIAIVTNDFLSGTDTLLAMVHDGVLTIWGRNSSNQVYYLSCPTAQIAVPGSWSTPVPILSGVERISAYVNRLDGGNTIFASGNGKLQKTTQGTSAAGRVWRTQEIHLASQPKQKALEFKSYTTTVHVVDENDLPATDTTLVVSANTRTPVYINGLYYSLSTTPVKVNIDAMGSITVVEATDDINSATLTVSIEGAANSIGISPMHKSFQKLTSLNSEDKLRDASFPSETVAGGVMGSSDSKPLVPASTADDDVQVVAANLDQLGKIYTDLNSSPKALLANLNHGVVPSTLFLASGKAPESLWDDIAMAAGDLFAWLKSGVEAIIDVVYDAVSDAWHFIARIAGQAYRAILDTVDAVVGAIQWVYNAIKTVIEDIIRFIEFLFEWDDIRRTKNVLHNIATLYVQHQVDRIPQAKLAFDEQVAAVEQTLDTWAGITDWSSLGDSASKPATGSSSNPAKNQTSGSQFLAGHFRNHASDLSVVGDSPSFHAVDDLVQTLLTAISDEGPVLEGVYKELQTLASQFKSMNVEDVLKALAAILAKGLLSSVQVVVDALLDVLHTLASAGVGVLDTKLHIPIISDILNAIGVPDISFLDLFTWIAAVGYTVVYKIVNNEAPFPDDSNTQAIISADSWDALAGLFHSQVQATSTKDEASSSTLTSLPQSIAQAIFVAGHATAGFIYLTGNFINAFEAESQTGDNVFSMPSAVMGIIAAAFQGGSDFLVPKNAVSNTAVSILSDATTVAVIASKLVFCGPAQSKFGASGSKFSSLAVNDGRATGAIVNTALIFPALFVTGWHLYELGQKPAGAERSAAIVGEVSNLTMYVSRVSYAVAVNDAEMESRQIPIGVMVVSNIAAAGLQTAEAIIH